MRESASADVIFVASWFSKYVRILTNITRNGPSCGVGEKEILKAFGRQHPSCVQKCSAPCRQEGFVLHECSNIEMNVNIS